jgi:hypothetical protein
MKNFKSIALLVAFFAIHSAPIKSAYVSDNVARLIEATRNKQLGVLFLDKGSVTEDWLIKAVGYIVNGRLTRANKEDVTDKIIQVIDVLYGTPLRNNPNITDEQYLELTSRAENRVRNFMKKLYVGGIYTM